ncbi:MAG: polysaccharide pyruvyl transferase family protein [Rivularia sp. (in: cyanobacteria)]
MKILVTNTVALNGGDAAILLSIINLLKGEFGQDTEFIVYDSQPEIAKRYYPQLNFRKLIYQMQTETPTMKYLGDSFISRALRLFFKKILQFFLSINPPRFYFAAWCWQHKFNWITKLLLDNHELQDIENYSSADLIVSTGGTYLVENYPLKSRIFDYRISLLMQKPLVFYTQSLGPFLNKNYQSNFREIFNRSLLILLRDEASFKHLQDIQVDIKKAHVSSDVVFAFTEKLEQENHFNTNSIGNSPLKIAVSVRNWQYFKTTDAQTGMNIFRESLSAVTKYLVEKYNAEITYISTCQGIPDYWNDDSKVAVEIIESLPIEIQKQVNVDRNFHAPQELIKILNSYDLVIATRMHMAILSLVARTPVFPIAYEFKTKELFQRLEMGEWVQDIENVQQESIIASIQLFIEKLPEIKQKLAINVKKEQKRALESAKRVKTAFEQYYQ